MKKILWVGAVFAALTGLLVAQPVTQNQISGNECWNAGQGPGGPSAGFVCINLVRGGTPNTAWAGAGGSFTIGVGNSTGPISDGGNLLVTAQPAAATITLPANPVPDGAIVGFCNVTGSPFSTNVVTFVANSGQTLAVAATLTTQAAGTCTREQWNQAALTWYRVQ